MIGQKLGPFLIEEKIGAGAMGVVYRGVIEDSGRAVAIKVLSGEAAMKGNASLRFRREADILKQFSHPNIVRYVGFGRSQSRSASYIAMEFIRGRTLEALLEDGGALPWREVVELGIQICEALHYSHERGVFHRDLKPSNLMVTEVGLVKLTDFGIAKDEDATALTATGRTMGTAAYMAPEQIRGTPEISHKTDLYALGVLLYQMLVGECPYQGKSAVVLMHAHLTEPVPRPSDKVEEIPTALEDLILLLMAKTPSDRPWDAASVGQMLTSLRDKAVRGEPIPMVWDSAGNRTGSVTIRTTRRKRPKKKPRSPDSILPPWAGTAALGLALAGLIGIVAYLLWPPGPDYLHRHAAALMASENPDDWRRAKSEYLDDLLRRFPKSRHRVEVDEWLDKIALHLARQRAASMARGLGQVRAGTEEQFDDTRRRAEEAGKIGRDVVAARLWRELAAALESSPSDRGWHLLALERASKVAKEIEGRRRLVTDMLDQADRDDLKGEFEQANRLRSEVVNTYAIYPDLNDLIRRARAGLTPSAPPTTPPEKPE